MKVACIQLSTGENINLNYKKIIHFIEEAIKNKADFIVTPEASSILTDNRKKLLLKSYTMDTDPLVKKVQQISKKNKKWILLGSIFIKDKKKLKNRSILIDSNGSIKEYYDKINMFDVSINKYENYNESSTFTAGNKFKYAKLPWGNLGMTICYDLRFPELFRKLSKKKLNFISVPSAFTYSTGKKHWLALLTARAIENFCYIFAPNQYGWNTKKRRTFGHTVIISPDGKVLKIKKNGQGVIYAKIKPFLPLKLRKVIPSLKSI